MAHLAQDPPSTELLARLVVETPADQLPDDVAEHTRLTIFDTIVCAAAGMTTSAAQAARSAGPRVFGSGRSTVWFTGRTQAPGAALLANIVATTILDLDDGHRLARGHPAAGVVPVALELASRTSTPVAEILTAVALGYEVGVRVSASRDPQRVPTWASGPWVAYAAAATAARILGLDVPATTHALAIAGAWAPTMVVNEWTTEKGTAVKEGIGWAAVAGVTAAELAADGFTGPRDVLDGASAHRREVLVGGTGVEWAVLRSYTKPYSACRYAHPAIDLALRIRDQITSEVTAIEVFTFERALSLNNYPSPPTAGSAQFSVPFCVALALIHGADAVALVTDRFLTDPSVTSLAGHVDLHVDATYDAAFPERTGARVVVHTVEGEPVELATDDASGDWTTGARREVVDQKFSRLQPLIATGDALCDLPEAMRLVEDADTGRLLELLATTQLAM